MPDATEPTAPSSLPAASSQDDFSTMLLGPTQSPSLQIMLNPKLYDRCAQFAKIMSKADGITPKHLLGKTEACFAVITRALTWKLDPFAVAQSTFVIPGGDKIGYEGRLCQAILENSGMIEGGVKFEHFGDWSKIQGKFKIETSQKGFKYPVPAWDPKDEEGLGVIVRAKVKGEAELREWSLQFVQCFPRNSTMWATDPRSQICYTAVRRFASLAAPGVFMGVPFDRDDAEPYAYGADNAIDMGTAERVDRPTRSTPSEAEAERRRKEEDEPKSFELTDEVGEVVGTYGPREYLQQFAQAVDVVGKAGDPDRFQALIEGNEDTARRAGAAFNGGAETYQAIGETIAIWAKRLAPKDDQGPENQAQDERKPEATETRAEPAPAGQAQADGSDDPIPDEGADAKPEVPAEFTWVAANNQPYKYPTIERWKMAVLKSLIAANGDKEKLAAAQERNKDTLRAYNQLGGVHADAVGEVLTALNPGPK